MAPRVTVHVGSSTFHLFIFPDFMEVDQLPTRPPRTLDPQEKESEDADLEEEDDEARSSLRRKKRQAPYIIFPEILCIVDYDGYRFDKPDKTSLGTGKQEGNGPIDLRQQGQ